MGENTEYANNTDLLVLINLDKIRKMAEFPQNWNGTGGQVFSANSVKVFTEVLEGLRIQPQIAPTGRNSLLLQYDFGDSGILAFELSENTLSAVYIPQRDFTRVKEEVFVDNFVERINECAVRAYQR